MSLATADLPSDPDALRAFAAACQAENAMRGIALGRKNYLFAGADSGGHGAAAMYTIVQRAKVNDLNPEAYLRDTLGKIAEGHPISRIDEPMPWRAIESTAA